MKNSCRWRNRIWGSTSNIWISKISKPRKMTTLRFIAMVIPTRIHSTQTASSLTTLLRINLNSEMLSFHRLLIGSARKADRVLIMAQLVKAFSTKKLSLQRTPFLEQLAWIKAHFQIVYGLWSLNSIKKSKMSATWMISKPHSSIKKIETAHSLPFSSSSCTIKGSHTTVHLITQATILTVTTLTSSRVSCSTRPPSSKIH